MKILITIIFLSLLSSPSWSEIVTDLHKDLVRRDGLYYKKFSRVPFSGFSKVPFSGNVTGLYKGNIKNGKREGEWVCYRSDGQ